jgi:hypothetical protein
MTKDDFSSFLYYKNNRCWTRLYRQGLQLADHLPELKIAINYLQNDAIPIEKRINDVTFEGRLWVRGFGWNISTSILHICDNADRYGVWNGRSDDSFRKLGLHVSSSGSAGRSYVNNNANLQWLKKMLDNDLEMIDGFMWYVSKYK